MRARLGSRVQAGDALAEIHLAREDDGVATRAAACFQLGEGAVASPPLVIERVE